MSTNTCMVSFTISWGLRLQKCCPFPDQVEQRNSGKINNLSPTNLLGSMILNCASRFQNYGTQQLFEDDQLLELYLLEPTETSIWFLIRL
ncbi:hypothetical protein SLA2020_525120 [Shorea laevis]